MYVVLLILLAILALYKYNVKNFDYWKKRGVKYVKPVIFFGSRIEIFLLQKSITEIFTGWYKSFPDEKVVGYFRNSEPALLIRDPELVKRVLVTDFVQFHQRGLHPDSTSIEPLLSNIFFADGDLWRLLRQRMTPAFTSGKLKAMFPLIVERAEQLQLRTLQSAQQNRIMDARDLMARYTTDFIGACGFGLDTGSLNDENSAFRKLGDQLFQFGLREYMVIFMKVFFPVLAKKINYLNFKIENEVLSLVRQIVEQRNNEPSDRNDFIDLLLESKKKGMIEGESLVNVKADGTPERVTLELTDKLLAAQVLVFFAAGFETSSSATSYTLHQLAHNPEAQKKAQQNIDEVLKRHNNKLSYEAVKEFTYLEWAFKEGMRLFPSLGYLNRKCVRKYTFPELNLTIDEGVYVSIPLQGLHTDPQYFDNPLNFKPERFSSDHISDANKYVYLPFGGGPRGCIGERLGLMQSIAGMAAILSKFTVIPAPQSKRYPSVQAKFDVVQNIKGGLPLIFMERKKTQ